MELSKLDPEGNYDYQSRIFPFFFNLDGIV